MVKEYDPEMIDVIFSGFPLSGFAEDSIVEVEYESDRFQIVAGVDGDVSRSRIVARIAKVTVHLMNTSRSNADLTLVMALGSPGSGTADVAPLLIRDRNGASLMATDTCWIHKEPNVSHGAKAGPRDWVFMAVKPTFVEAGV